MENESSYLESRRVHFLGNPQLGFALGAPTSFVRKDCPNMPLGSLDLGFLAQVPQTSGSPAAFDLGFPRFVLFDFFLLLCLFCFALLCFALFCFALFSFTFFRFVRFAVHCFTFFHFVFVCRVMLCFVLLLLRVGSVCVVFNITCLGL